MNNGYPYLVCKRKIDKQENKRSARNIKKRAEESFLEKSYPKGVDS